MRVSARVCVCACECMRACVCEGMAFNYTSHTVNSKILLLHE